MVEYWCHQARPTWTMRGPSWSDSCPDTHHSTYLTLAMACLPNSSFWLKQCVHQYAPYILASIDLSFLDNRSACKPTSDGRGRGDSLVTSLKKNCKGKSATCPYGSIFYYLSLWASPECCVERTMIQRPVSQETRATPTESSWIKPHSQEHLESKR